MNRQEELADRAGRAWRQGNFSEAKRSYEEMLSLQLSPLDRAKILANLMQTSEKAGDVDGALHRGQEAFALIEQHDLADSDEGAHLRGFVRGALARLRGEGLDSKPLAGMLFAYFAGGVFGAFVGSHISVSSDAATWTDLRHTGTGLGAILGWLVFTRLTYRLPTGISVIGSLLSFGWICWFVTRQRPQIGGIVIGGLLLMIVVRWIATWQATSRFGQRV